LIFGGQNDRVAFLKQHRFSRSSEIKMTFFAIKTKLSQTNKNVILAQKMLDSTKVKNFKSARKIIFKQLRTEIQAFNKEVQHDLHFVIL